MRLNIPLIRSKSEESKRDSAKINGLKSAQHTRKGYFHSPTDCHCENQTERISPEEPHTAGELGVFVFATMTTPLLYLLCFFHETINRGRPTRYAFAAVTNTAFTILIHPPPTGILARLNRPRSSRHSLARKYKHLCT